MGEPLAASAAITSPPAGPQSSRPIVRLWSDRIRLRQRARLKKLRTRQFDECRSAGRVVWAEAKRIQTELPLECENDDGSLRRLRVDLPSPDVFALILGVFRSGATLKAGKGDGKILELELSAGDIAELIGRSKATVEAALRFLSCARIQYRGVAYGRALGIVHRRLRYGRAYLAGRLRWVHRTSSIVLTIAGRLLLGLPQRREERLRERYQNARKVVPLRAPSPSPAADAAMRARQSAMDKKLPEPAAGPGCDADVRAQAAAARKQIRRQLRLD